MDGKKIKEHKVKKGTTEITLPASIVNGLYMGVFKPEDNGIPDAVRFIYQR